jgi:hypothetical protein
MNAFNLSLVSLFLAGSALAADAPVTVAPGSVVSSGSSDPLAEALTILQAKYVDFNALNYQEGDRLSDLIARSGGKISLTMAGSALPPGPIITATLGNVLYWRLASFNPEKGWPDLEAQLEQAAPDAEGIVLDLRSNVAPDDYAGAARVLALFAPEDETLNQAAGIGGNAPGVKIPDRTFRAPIVVLTNQETTGAVEALAACLRADGALVVGRATAGKMELFAEQTLSTGEVLRYAVGPVCAADAETAARLREHALAWGEPVVPDISPGVTNQAEKRALILIGHGQVAEVVQEAAERRRMTEAALVHGQDPEYDDYLASLENKEDIASLPPIHDVVLTTALDSLKAIHLTQGWAHSPVQAEAAPDTSSSVQ